MTEKKTLQVDISLFEDVPKVLLAVSGGADSVAMAHVMVHLRTQGRLSCEFVIGHLNHCLRGEHSDADEAFVRALAQSLDVPVVTKSVDVKAYAEENKLSIETAARQVRLKTLAAMAKAYQCDCVATAHHKDDLAETMVHRLMRGTGFRGLCGIRPASVMGDTNFIRPMLAVGRGELIEYCTSHSIQWREDVSNRCLDFTRNRIRHRMMPFLETESCEIVNKLAQLAQQSLRFQMTTENHAQTIIEKGRLDLEDEIFSINQTHLKESNCWVFYEVIREVLVKLGIGLRPYTREHFDRIRKLIAEDCPGVMLPNGLMVSTTGEKLVFNKGTQPSGRPEIPDKPVRLEVGKITEFGPWRISSRLLNGDEVDLDRFMKSKDAYIEWFDADKISGAIEVRPRRDGDRFRPIGGKGEKKVARFLQDAQLPTELRNLALIIADTDKILWLAPIRMSESVKVAKTTSKLLEIRICFD